MRLPSSNVILLLAILLVGVLLCLLNLSHIRHDATSNANSATRLMESSSSAWLLLSAATTESQNQPSSSSLSLEASVQAEKLEQAQLKIDRLLQELDDTKRKLQDERTPADCSPKKESGESSPNQHHRTLSSYPPVCQSWMQDFLVPPSTESTSTQSSSPLLLPSALSIWNAYLPNILQHSRHVNDRTYLLHDFTAHLLQLMSDRLVNSVKTVPRLASQWDRVGDILEVIQARRDYLQHVETTNDNTTVTAPRKLRIVIMGGSLLVGVNCRKVVSLLKLQGLLMPNRLCTWSSRLEVFLNNILGSDVVQIDKVAVGGTNSGTGRTILEYELMPHSHPDILINAYSTNDMHITTVQEAEKSNQTLEDKVFELTQGYIRAALNPSSSGGCRPRTPLLLHMDDYLGNEQREIWTTTGLSRSAQVLANYYGFASMSYADVARDLVYGHTREQWLSPNGWYNDKDEFEREIHPSMAMHITAMWVTAYNLLNMATTYCSMHHAVMRNPEKAIEYRSGVGGMPKISGKKVPDAKPEYPPRGLPPMLTRDLSLEFVSNLWRNSSTMDESVHDCSEDEMESQATKRCPFAWVADLSQQQKNETWIKELFDERTVENTGWELKNDFSKLGYVPKEGVVPTLVLEFTSVTRPIRVVTVFYMKSYGDDWASSRMQLGLSRRANKQDEWKDIHQEELLASHEKTTSETYTLEHTLKDGGVAAGSDLRISMAMKAGSKKFKLQGLAVCS